MTDGKNENSVPSAQRWLSSQRGHRLPSDQVTSTSALSWISTSPKAIDRRLTQSRNSELVSPRQRPLNNTWVVSQAVSVSNSFGPPQWAQLASGNDTQAAQTGHVEGPASAGEAPKPISPHGETLKLDWETVKSSAKGEPQRVRTPFFETPITRLVEIEIEIEAADLSSNPKIARLLSKDGSALSHASSLRVNTTKQTFLVPKGHDHICIEICDALQTDGISFTLQRVAIRQLDPETYRHETSKAIGAKVVASLASIPERAHMLRDCVDSLLVQCDEVRVFLNHYSYVPPFLRHPRVVVARSQDWDDRGDAGKFFWIGEDDKDGYRIVVDDDLAFPPEFARTLCQRLAQLDNKVILTMGGELLMQSITQQTGSYGIARQFEPSERVTQEHPLHIGSTSAMAFHAKLLPMRWSDFRFPNSADLWISTFAHAHDVPILLAKREADSLQKLSMDNDPTSETPAPSSFRDTLQEDVKVVRDATIKANLPIVTRSPDRSKLLFILAGFDLQKCRHVVAGLEEACALSQPSFLLVDCEGESKILPLQNTASELFITDKDCLDRCLDKLCKASGTLTTFLFMEDETDAQTYLSRAPDQFTFTRLDNDSLDDSLDAKATLGPLNIASVTEATDQLCPKSAGFAALVKGQETAAASEPQPKLFTPRISNQSLISVNQVFDEVYVINLKRRPDRWETLKKRLTRQDIKAVRIDAVDGSRQAVLDEYERYNQTAFVPAPFNAPQVGNKVALHSRYASQTARVAYLEDGRSRKAIESKGAWAILKSYEKVFIDALERGLDRCLILEDDVIFHKDFQSIFDKSVRQLPDDWKLLQLGTLQYSWSPRTISNYSENLYRSFGMSVGSHAVGYQKEVIPYILEFIKRMDLPYDVGPLSACVKEFSDQSFYIYPHIAIQELGNSDIASSDFQKYNSLRKVLQTYRWVLDDYDI